MNDATLLIVLGAGTLGGLLWYGAQRQAHAHARAPGVPDVTPPGAAASSMARPRRRSVSGPVYGEHSDRAR